MTGDTVGCLPRLRRWARLAVCFSLTLPLAAHGQSAARRAAEARSAKRAADAASAERRAASFKPGQQVDAMFTTKWLPATVVAVEGDRVRVRFDEDGTVFPIKADRVRARAGAAAGGAAGAKDAGGAPGAGGGDAGKLRPVGRGAGTTPPAEDNDTPDPPEDAGPALTDADLSGARQVTLNASAAWSYAPPPAKAKGPPAAGGDRPLTVPVPPAWVAQPTKRFETARDPGSLEVVEGVLAPSPDSPFVVTVHTASAPGSRVTQLRAQRVEIPSGKSGWKTDLPGGLKVRDVSPDGTRVLLRPEVFSKTPKGRVDVYSVSANKPATLVVAFEPYKGEDTLRADILFARFVDNDHVLTVSNGGKLVLWRLDGAKAEYVIERGGSGVPVLDASRAVAAWPGRDRGVFFLDAKTGKTLGRCDSEDKVWNLSLRPDSTQLAATSGFRLLLWDLATGKPSHDLPVQAGVRTDLVHWMADGFLLLAGHDLLDLSRGVVVWEYGTGITASNPLTHPNAAQLSGGRLAVLGGGLARRGGGSGTMAVLSLPHAAARQYAQKLDTKDALVVGPGSKVSLEITTDAPAEQRQRIEEHINQELRQNGVTVADGAPVKLVVSSTAGQTNQIEFDRNSPGGGRVLNVTEQLHRVAFMVGDVVAWQTGTTFKGEGLLSRQAGETLEQTVERHKAKTYQFLEVVKIPRMVPRPKELIPPGKSKVTERGIEDAPPAAKPKA